MKQEQILLTEQKKDINTAKKEVYNFISNMSTLADYTTQIKQKEKAINNSFIEIGKSLKIINDKKLYKEKYSEFNDYIKSEGFSFSERHAYSLIRIAEKFGEIDCTKFGITKCIALLQLDKEELKQYLTEHDVNKTTVSELKTDIADKKAKPTVDLDLYIVIKTLDKRLFRVEDQLADLLQTVEQYKAKKGNFKTNPEQQTTTAEITKKIGIVKKQLEQVEEIMNLLK